MEDAYRGIEIPNKLPLLPLRDIVVFPFMVIPLFVGRGKSIKALEEATANNRLIMLATQKKVGTEDPKEGDLYNIGVVAEILQLLKLPDGTVKVLAEGLMRVKVEEFTSEDPYLYVEVGALDESYKRTPELEALIRTCAQQFEEYIGLNRRFPPETVSAISGVEDPVRLADIIAAHLNLKIQARQEILEIANPKKRLEKLFETLNAEIEILQIETKIQGRVRKQMEKSQREYYLTEQLHAIQRELGKRGDQASEVEELKEKINRARMSKEAQEKATKELERLERMPPLSSETAVIRNYLDWMINLPWDKKTKDKLDIDRAQKILEEDHYGLDKVKERVLEYLAVRKLVKQMKGPILCFVGPPGTGKTSVAKSIARSMGRKFVRISLGGVRDEAEIRGHRMTYVAALPGRIIQSMKKAKSKNPVFLLDEVDKMSVDFRGDPSAALLEVLDPEQNSTFSDHYLEVPFDLSDVMFITTANVLYSIPVPLQDRMEILEFPSYIEDEKSMIAQRFLIPKQLKAHGLRVSNLTFSDEAVLTIIRRYTREAGVRNLEREMAAVCRKVAKEVAKEGRKIRIRLARQNLHKYLGPPKYRVGSLEEESRSGVANGLAWTEAGGVVLITEAMVMPGKGELILTGKLGEVMKESGRAALSYARTRAKALNLEPNFYKNLDFHIHVPEGAIPKDGPSAGVTMATALISSLTNRPVNSDVAMTGEITLRGRVLPVGGIKEKILAAHRMGIKRIIAPKENERDLDDLPPKIRRRLKIELVDSMDEVLNIALLNSKPIEKKTKSF